MSIDWLRFQLQQDHRQTGYHILHHDLRPETNGKTDNRGAREISSERDAELPQHETERTEIQGKNKPLVMSPASLRSLFQRSMVSVVINV